MHSTVYVVDDDELVIESLSLALELEYKIRSFTTATEFLNENLDANAVLVLDLSLPDMHGLQVQEQLIELGHSLPIIIYSGTADVPDTVAALTQGAYTLLQKPTSLIKLRSAIREALEDFKTKREQLERVEQAKEQIKLLSKRELDVGRLAVQGYSAQKIAETLFISPRTAEAHKANIFSKLNINSIALLAHYFALAETDI